MKAKITNATKKFQSDLKEKKIELSPDVIKYLTKTCNGDARKLLNLFEAMIQTLNKKI